MRRHRHLAWLAVAALLGGCGTLADFVNESYLLERQRGAEMRSPQGAATAWIDMEERQNVHTGRPFIEFKASNHGGVPLCARAWVDQVDADGGYRFGSWHLVPPGGTVLIGFVNDYYTARGIDTDWRYPGSDGRC